MTQDANMPGIEDRGSGRRRVHMGRVTVGLVILAAGLVTLLGRTGAVTMDLGRLFAPALLITIGLTRVVGAWYSCDQRVHPLTGFWLIVVGIWMLISEYHVFGLSYQTSWPLLIVAAGLLLVLQEVTGVRRTAADASRDSNDREAER